MAGIPTSFINNTGILDLVRGVIKNFDQDMVSQTQLLTSHPFIRRLMGPKAKSHSGGPMSNVLRVREGNGFKWVNMLESRGPNRVDLTVELQSEPKHSDDAFMFDMRENAFTSGNETRIFDALDQQYNQMKIGMWDNWEEALIGMPSSSAATEEPIGVSGFLRPLAANEESADGSFNGIYAVYDDGTQTATIGGQDASTTANSRLRSRCATDDGGFHAGTIDQITKQRLATTFNFVPGMKAADTGAIEGGNWVACSTARYAAACEYADKVIMSGPDGMIAPQHNEITVRGLTFVHAPKLDDFADDPMLAIVGENIFGYKLKGWWMRTLGPQPYNNSMTIMQVGIASSGALHCKNPRGAGFRICKKRTS